MACNNNIGRNRVIHIIGSLNRAISVALIFHFLILVKEITSGQFEHSSNNMGYLNSVLSSSSQVHADDAPVSGGGLRLLNSLVFCSDLAFFLLFFLVDYHIT